MLARFGNDGDVINMGDYNMKFVIIGTVVGYAIIVPAILCTYLMGANLTFLVSSILKLMPYILSTPLISFTIKVFGPKNIFSPEFPDFFGPS